MQLFKEFKSFAMKGSIVDLAIGIIIGAAFSRIVSSLVNDIITPALLDPALKAANLSELNKLVIPGTGIKYGNFISEVLSFLIVAFSLFIIVRFINRESRRKKAAAQPVAPPALTLSEQLLTEIRDNTRKTQV